MNDKERIKIMKEINSIYERYVNAEIDKAILSPHYNGVFKVTSHTDKAITVEPISDQELYTKKYLEGNQNDIRNQRQTDNQKGNG